MNEAKYMSAKHGLQGPQQLSYSIVVWLYKTLDDMFGVRTRVASIAMGREHTSFPTKAKVSTCSTYNHDWMTGTGKKNVGMKSLKQLFQKHPVDKIDQDPRENSIQRLYRKIMPTFENNSNRPSTRNCRHEFC